MNLGQLLSSQYFITTEPAAEVCVRGSRNTYHVFPPPGVKLSAYGFVPGSARYHEVGFDVDRREVEFAGADGMFTVRTYHTHAEAPAGEWEKNVPSALLDWKRLRQ